MQGPSAGHPNVHTCGPRTGSLTAPLTRAPQNPDCELNPQDSGEGESALRTSFHAQPPKQEMGVGDIPPKGHKPKDTAFSLQSQTVLRLLLKIFALCLPDTGALGPLQWGWWGRCRLLGSHSSGNPGWRTLEDRWTQDLNFYQLLAWASFSVCICVSE